MAVSKLEKLLIWDRMQTFITIIMSVLGGFFIHALTMKVNFKQRTIDNKIRVYDALIINWIMRRNHIFSSTSTHMQMDQMYGESQKFIGEIFLVSENTQLAELINNFNERFYRTPWQQMQINEKNPKIEELKTEGIGLITRMREDIKGSTRLETSDFTHALSGLRNKHS